MIVFTLSNMLQYPITLKPFDFSELIKKTFLDYYEVDDTIFPCGLNFTAFIGFDLKRRIYFKILICLTFVISTTLITPSLLPINKS